MLQSMKKKGHISMSIIIVSIELNKRKEKKESSSKKNTYFSMFYVIRTIDRSI